MDTHDGRVAPTTGAPRGGAVPYPRSTEADLLETIQLSEKSGRRALPSVADVRDPIGLQRARDAELGVPTIRLHHGLAIAAKGGFVINAKRIGVRSTDPADVVGISVLRRVPRASATRVQETPRVP